MNLLWFNIVLAQHLLGKVLKVGKYGDLNVVLFITPENNILQLVMQNDITVCDIYFSWSPARSSTSLLNKYHERSSAEKPSWNSVPFRSVSDEAGAFVRTEAWICNICQHSFLDFPCLSILNDQTKSWRFVLAAPRLLLLRKTRGSRY